MGTYAYITASNARFLIQVNDNQFSEESIKRFFSSVQEVYVKNIMNPLYKVGTKIVSQDFDLRIKVLISNSFR